MDGGGVAPAAPPRSSGRVAMATLTRMDRDDGDGPARRGLAWRHAFAVAAGAAAGAALVALVFVKVGWDGGPVVAPRFDVRAFARGLPAHARWVVPFALVAACLPGLRAVVWRAEVRHWG